MAKGEWGSFLQDVVITGEQRRADNVLEVKSGTVFAFKPANLRLLQP